MLVTLFQSIILLFRMLILLPNKFLGHNVPIDLHVNNSDSAPFQNWGIALSSLFKKAPGIQSYHFFQVRNTSKGFLYMKNLPSDEWTAINLRKSGKSQLDSINISVTSQRAKGLNPEKIYDLWKRYGEYVPEKYKSTLYSKPSDDIIQQITATKRQRVYDCIARKKVTSSKQTGETALVISEDTQVNNRINEDREEPSNICNTVGAVEEVVEEVELIQPKKRKVGRPRKIVQ